MGAIYQEAVRQLSGAYVYNPFRMARILGGGVGWGAVGGGGAEGKMGTEIF